MCCGFAVDVLLDGGLVMGLSVGYVRVCVDEDNVGRVFERLVCILEKTLYRTHDENRPIVPSKTAYRKYQTTRQSKQ